MAPDVAEEAVRLKGADRTEPLLFDLFDHFGFGIGPARRVFALALLSSSKISDI